MCPGWIRLLQFDALHVCPVVSLTTLRIKMPCNHTWRIGDQDYPIYYTMSSARSEDVDLDYYSILLYGVEIPKHVGIKRKYGNLKLISRSARVCIPQTTHTPSLWRDVHTGRSVAQHTPITCSMLLCGERCATLHSTGSHDDHTPSYIPVKRTHAIRRKTILCIHDAMRTQWLLTNISTATAFVHTSIWPFVYALYSELTCS